MSSCRSPASWWLRTSSPFDNIPLQHTCGAQERQQHCNNGCVSRRLPGTDFPALTARHLVIFPQSGLPSVDNSLQWEL
jgi:hypothetical protein